MMMMFFFFLYRRNQIKLSVSWVYGNPLIVVIFFLNLLADCFGLNGMIVIFMKLMPSKVFKKFFIGIWIQDFLGINVSC